MCGRNGLQRPGVPGGGPIDPALRMAGHLRGNDRILVAAHGNPDGDAVGATAAVGWLLRALGKTFALYNATGIPDHLSWLPFPDPVRTRLDDLPFTPGLVVALDCGDAWRLGNELAEVLPRYASVNIDHHPGNPEFGSLDNWIAPQMAATGQMAAAIADAAGIPLTGPLAECVYVALVSDTGSFTHANTDAAVFALAARLMAEGLDAAAVRDRLDNQWSMAKARLWGVLLGKLRLECDDRICVCEVRQADLAACGAVKDDLEGFVEQMRKLKGVKVAFLAREDHPRRTKISLRSSAEQDVRTVAALFGGGGHKNAAGASLDEPPAETARRVLEILASGLKSEAAENSAQP